MAIAYVSTAVAGVGTTTTGNISYPASIAAGDGLLLITTCKYPSDPENSGTDLSPTISGWTRIGFARSTGLSPGADAGNTCVYVWFKVAAGTESGTFTISNPAATQNSVYARVFRFTKAADKTWGYESTQGRMNTAGTAWSINFDSALTLAVDDMAVFASCFNSDVGGVSGYSASGSVASFGTVTERDDAGTSQGEDCRQFVATSPVTGAGSTASLTYAATITTSVAGATCLVRLREIDPGGAGASTGAATAAATGASTADCSGPSAGVATAAATGASTADAAGASAGAATAAATGLASADTVGASAGAATAAATGLSTAPGAGTSAGVATAAAIGVAAITGVGTCAGTSTAAGVGVRASVGTGIARGKAHAFQYLGKSKRANAIASSPTSNLTGASADGHVGRARTR